MTRKVGVAELKSRLSHYLRIARGGRSIVVVDRGNPIAELVPYQNHPGNTLVVRERATGSVRPSDFVAPPPLLSSGDVDDLLAGERGED